MKTWTTYRMEDGSSICGEYAWVENEEFFEDIDEPVRVVKETWVLQSTEVVTFDPFWWDEDEFDSWYDDEEKRRPVKNKEE